MMIILEQSFWLTIYIVSIICKLPYLWKLFTQMVDEDPTTQRKWAAVLVGLLILAVSPLAVLHDWGKLFKGTL